jgi:ribonuclease E
VDHDTHVEDTPASMTPTETPATTTGAEQPPGTTGSSPARRRRRRGGRGRGRGRSGSGGAKAAGAPQAPEDGSTAEAGSAVPANVSDERPKPEPDQKDANDQPRPRQRSGQQQRRRKPSTARKTDAAEAGETRAEASAETDAAGSAEPAVEGVAASPEGAPRKRRRRRGGRGRGRKPAAASPVEGPVEGSVGVDDDTAPVDPVEAQRDDAEPDADAAGGPRSATRRRRRPSATRADDAAPPASAEAPARAARSTRPKTIEEQVAAGGPTRGVRTTRTRTGRDGRRRREPIPTPPRITDKLMVITEHGERDQIAVLEENVLVQHYVTRVGATSMVGNIYLGRVQNVLPGMEAAFVDVGRGRNGVLYAGEVNYSLEDIEGNAPRIEQLLKPGQAVMVQVTKDPMGGKGARLTANLSLAGRYLVLAPNQDLQGISRRLPDEARKRLKALLKRVKPPEHGVIVRTAAESATEEALETDLRRLLAVWEDIQSKAKKGKAPTPLYEEPELTVRVVRDLFTDEEYRGLVTDSNRVYEMVMGYVREVAPDLAEKVTLHAGALPVFEEHRIVEQIHKALDRKVWLPSGGYLIIERTEAMTIVDVNTGKSVGKTNLEETVVNTNLEAAREAARQLRLRDIGGIIVIDFIDMLLEKNKKQVEDTMRDALAIDKTRSQVFEIGPLGLMQVTRKRVSSGLVESFSEVCPTCEGRGIILTYDVN